MYNEFTNHIDIKVDNEILEVTKEYIYLGQLVTMCGNFIPEINRRIKLGWSAFGRNSMIFKSNMPLYLKKKTFDQCILPVLTYGCETWTLNTTIVHKLQVAQRNMERSMLGITRRDRKRIDWIRQKTKVSDIVERIKSLKWSWAGHVARRTDDRWTRKVLEWYPRGVKRPRKRPQDRWDRDIRRTAGNSWMTKAGDRDCWTRLRETYIRQ